jgi:hypothetical protein
VARETHETSLQKPDPGGETGQPPDHAEPGKGTRDQALSKVFKRLSKGGIENFLPWRKKAAPGKSWKRKQDDAPVSGLIQAVSGSGCQQSP